MDKWVLEYFPSILDYWNKYQHKLIFASININVFSRAAECLFLDVGFLQVRYYTRNTPLLLTDAQSQRSLLMSTAVISICKNAFSSVSASQVTSVLIYYYNSFSNDNTSQWQRAWLSRQSHGILYSEWENSPQPTCLGQLNKYKVKLILTEPWPIIIKERKSIHKYKSYNNINQNVVTNDKNTWMKWWNAVLNYAIVSCPAVNWLWSADASEQCTR